MTPHPPQDTGARCHAGSDGECNWDECPQNREGEPMRSGRSCPLADWSDEEVGYPTGRITKFGAAGSPDRTASRDTPNPTEEQTSAEFGDWLSGRTRDWLRAPSWTEKALAHAAWDARQPEIDRLRELVRSGMRHQPMHNGRPSCPLCDGFTDVEGGHFKDCIAREALDG